MPVAVTVRGRKRSRPRGDGGVNVPAPGDRLIPQFTTADGWTVDTIRWNLVPDYDYAAACEGLSEEGIRQELEIDWSATSGKRVYPQFGRGHHVATVPLKFNPRATLYCGWDFGSVPAFVPTQLNVFGQWLIFPSLSPPESAALGVYEFGQMVADYLQREFAAPLGLDLKELRLAHFGDPAGAARPPRTGDRPRETQSCFEILDRGLILHRAEAGGKEIIEKRPGWGWKIRPGPVNITARLEAVRARLMLNLRDGLPALVVDPRADTVIHGFQGGYCYPTRHDGSYGPDPAKEGHAGWFSHCLPAETLIETRRGQVPIREVTIQDHVMTRSGWQRVEKSWCSGVSELVEIAFEDGRTLRATGNHRVWTDGGWVKAVALRYNNVCSAKPLPLRGSSTPGIPTLPAALTGCTFAAAEEARRSGFTRPCGSRLTGPFQRVTRFIIATAIRSTMSWRIWSVLRTPSTAWRTGRWEPARQCAAGNTWTRYGIWPPSGTVLPRAASGTGFTAWRRRKPPPGEISSASDVGASINPTRHTGGTATAATGVVPPPAATPDWTTKHGLVRSVGNRSRSIATHEQPAAPLRVVSVTDLGRSEPVYDLAVRNAHEFYANGVLVHNSFDALAYVAARLFHTVKEVEEEDSDQGASEFRSHAASRYE